MRANPVGNDKNTFVVIQNLDFPHYPFGKWDDLRIFV